MTTRKILRIVLSLSLALSITTTNALALSTVTMNNPQNNFTWDPDIRMVQYETEDSSLRLVSFFRFNEANVNDVIDVEENLYYVMEHYNHNDNGKATEDDLYTNIPYAKPDVEDDLFSNRGFQEELEMGCYSGSDPAPFQANVTYFFDTTWHNESSGSVNMRIGVRSQQSEYWAIVNELQAINTEYHGDTPTFTVSGSSRNSEAKLIEVTPIPVDNSGAIETTNSASEEITEPIIVSHNVNTFDECTAEMQKQLNILDAMSETGHTEQEKLLLKNAKVTVTFAQPINVQQFNKIMASSDAEINYCTLKFEDEQGLRITGWTNDLSEDHLQDKLSYLREMHGDVEYCGIVSAELEMDLTKGSHLNLANSDLVYFADFSDPIVRFEQKDFNNRLDISIMDKSWDLEFAD